MGYKNLLIVGVDPGTTVGYAALDFDGNIIAIDSGKSLDLNNLLSELVNLGKVLIIASDKEHTPEFVNKVAIKIGARVINPNYDLKVFEKNEIAKHHKTNNQHEIDALAAALFALKKIDPLLKKIDIFVEHYKKENIKKELIEFVVGKELNIKDAADIIERPAEEESKIIKEVVSEKKLEEKDFLRLYRKFKDSAKEIMLLKQQNKRLLDQMNALKRDYQYMLKQISKSHNEHQMKSLVDFKEQRVKIFDDKVKRKEEEINSLRNEVTMLLYFLSNINSNILLKKLDNLGFNEFDKKKKMLNIKSGDVLLVKDPDIISENVILELKNKVNIIFYRKPVSKKIEAKLPFIFIDANKVQIEENSYFAILAKDEFERVKHKSNIIDKIVADYRSARG